jgi:biotin--protein ligase
VYYNGGCFFKDAETFPSVEILAYYADLPDAPAIVECACSEGKAILSGVHPEYRVDWASREADAPPGLYDELSRHEAGSRGLFRRLLSRLGLPLSS